jgi:hypothetical protein
VKKLFVIILALGMTTFTALAQVGQIPGWPPIMPSSGSSSTCGVGALDLTTGCSNAIAVGIW